MRAMILAAGIGSRMRPLTLHTPKPLVQVAGKPLIGYALDLLREAGIHSAIINAHYLAEQIEAFAPSVTDMQLQLVREPQLLETGGGIANAISLLGDDVFVALNSDTICLSAPNLPVLSHMQQHWAARHDALLLIMPRSQAIGYDGGGDFVLDASGQRFRRRSIGDTGEAYVFTGVQLLHPRMFRDCPLGAFSMNILYNRYNSDVDGWFDNIGFIIHQGDWLHVGDPEALELANAFMQGRQVTG